METIRNLNMYLPKSIEEYWNKEYNRDQAELRPSVEVVKRGIILPIRKNNLDSFLFGLAGVTDEKGKYIEASTHYTAQGQAKHRYGLGYQPDSVQYIDEDVIFFGGYWKQWGHYILEQISRLWYAVQVENRGIDSIQNLKFAYFSNADDVIEWNGDDFSNLLLILGIKPSHFFHITSPTQFRTVIVPEQSMIFGKGFSNEYTEIIKKIAYNVEAKLSGERIDCPSKIYFSRTRFRIARYRELGEKRLQDSFESNGYKVLYPETMGLEKKIYYINHAQYIASLGGSAAHQTIFRVFNPEELNQIILLKDKEIESQSNELQVMINKHVGNKLFVVFACQSFYQAIGSIGPFLLYKTKFFRQYCNDQNIIIKRGNITDFVVFIKDTILFISLSIYRRLKKQYDPKKGT